MRRSNAIRLGALLLVALMLLTACASSKSKGTQVAPAAPAQNAKAADTAYSGSAPSASPAPKYDAVAVDPGAAAERKVVQTGRVELEVQDFAKGLDAIKALVAGAGGFVESSTTRDTSTGQPYGTLTIRVPQVKFDQLLIDLSKSGKIISSDVSGKDVTEQYIDMEARLKSAKAQEARLLDILTKAEKLEDILKIESELGRIRSDIESQQGRFNYLKNSVDLATLTVSLREVNAATSRIQNSIFGDLWQRVQRTFIGTLNGVLEITVALVVAIIGFSPVILLLAAIWLILRRVVHLKIKNPFKRP